MKKVLVFGGFGFLGYYLVKELLSKDYKVTVADINENEELIKLVKFIHCDISIKENVEKVFAESNYNYVYNLAGFARHKSV